MSVTFEGYERRIDKINRILNSYDRLRILYRYIKLIFDVIDDLE